MILLGSFASSEPRIVTQDQAREIAKKTAKESESTLRFDSGRLPPFSERVNDGFDFSVEDEKQNVTLFIHVSPRGLPEISGMPLDKYRNDTERLMKEAEEMKHLLGSPSP